MTLDEIVNNLDFEKRVNPFVPVKASDKAYAAGSTVYDIVNPPLTPGDIGVSRPSDANAVSTQVPNMMSDLESAPLQKFIEGITEEVYEEATQSFLESNKGKLPMLPWEKFEEDKETKLMMDNSAALNTYATGGNIPNTKAGILSSVVEKAKQFLSQFPIKTDLTSTNKELQRVDSIVSPIATGMRTSLNRTLGLIKDGVNEGMDSTKSGFNNTIDYLSNK